MYNPPYRKLTEAAAFIEASLFSKYHYDPANLTDGEMMDEDDDVPVLLQVSLHAFVECLSVFQISGVNAKEAGGGGLARAAENQRSTFQITKGSLRLIYKGDGEPFLVMCAGF